MGQDGVEGLTCETNSLIKTGESRSGDAFVPNTTSTTPHRKQEVGMKDGPGKVKYMGGGDVAKEFAPREGRGVRKENIVNCV